MCVRELVEASPMDVQTDPMQDLSVHVRVCRDESVSVKPSQTLYCQAVIHILRDGFDSQNHKNRVKHRRRHDTTLVVTMMR